MWLIILVTFLSEPNQRFSVIREILPNVPRDLDFMLMTLLKAKTKVRLPTCRPCASEAVLHILKTTKSPKMYRVHLRSLCGLQGQLQQRQMLAQTSPRVLWPLATKAVTLDHPSYNTNQVS